jgi:hypothetical protein
MGRPDGRFATVLRIGLLALAAALVGCSTTGHGQRGRLEEDRAVATVAREQIDARGVASGLGALAGPADCDVTVRAIRYATVAPDGSRATATGALLVPGGAACPGPHPIVAYSKGTDVMAARTLADPDDPETRLLSGVLASRGYVVVATDYLGFAGSSLDFHPYLHADSQASANVDAIRAARAALAASGVAHSGRLFVTGYSQGGHAAMATQRAIEADAGRRGVNAGSRLEVTAGAPMSGPYDLAGTFVDGARRLPEGSPGSPLFVTYLVTGYQRIYRDLYATPTDYFRPPYASGIESLLPGKLTPAQLRERDLLPRRLGDLVTPKLVDDLLDPRSALRRALDQNTLLGWTPRAPVLLCGGARDPVVPFANAVRARDALATRGARVEVLDVEQDPRLARYLPPQGAPPAALADYHGSRVPPLCLVRIRDTLFEPMR